MKIDGSSGVLVRLDSITRRVKTPDGEVKTVTYREGDPVFDEYAAEQKKRAEPHLPRNFVSFGYTSDGNRGFGTRRVDAAFRQYYAGTADEKQLEGMLSDLVADFRSSYVKRGFDPDEFMPQLLEDAYNACRPCNLLAADNQGWLDSRPLAAYYNGSDRNSRDTIYYDAKYYYQTEEMKVKLQDMFRRIGQRYGVSELDLPTDYPEGSLMKKMYTSYNTIINEGAGFNDMIGNMLDTDMVPPKDFRFFYKNNERGTNRYSPLLPSDGTPESTFDGILHVWYGDWSFVGRVPVRQDATRFPVSVNMYDVVAGQGGRIPKAIIPMLKNFDFFTVIQSGNYFSRHPR